MYGAKPLAASGGDCGWRTFKIKSLTNQGQSRKEDQVNKKSFHVVVGKGNISGRYQAVSKSKHSHIIAH